jgi:predicted small lipoprotein YifL
MKKIAILTLVLMLVLALAACGNTKPTQLGTSDFSIVLPDGYASTEDDFDEDQVAYFYKDDESIDFDVYQWEKSDEFTLESEANHFATEYGTTAEAVTVNGIKGYKYVSSEDYEGNTYTVINYMFEDDTNIVEICFWTVGDDAEYKAVDEIINSLKKN